MLKTAQGWSDTKVASSFIAHVIMHEVLKWCVCVTTNAHGADRAQQPQRWLVVMYQVRQVFGYR